jgi:hypothetical protein
MGLLNTMETILAVMEEKPEVGEGLPYWAVFGVGIRIGSGFSQVNGSGFGIRIQGGKNYAQK